MDWHYCSTGTGEQWRLHSTDAWLIIGIGPAGDPPRAEFGVWRHTGAVYRFTSSAAHDDPVIVPPGSTYSGPVEDW